MRCCAVPHMATPCHASCHAMRCYAAPVAELLVALLEPCVRVEVGEVLQHGLHLWCTTRYAVRTARPRLVRVRCTSVAQQLPCASGTYATQGAGTRSPYVQYGGSGTYGQHRSCTALGPSPSKSPSRPSSLRRRWCA